MAFLIYFFTASDNSEVFSEGEVSFIDDDDDDDDDDVFGMVPLTFDL